MSSRISHRFAVVVVLVFAAVGTARAGSPVTVYFDASHQGGSNNHGGYQDSEDYHFPG